MLKNIYKLLVVSILFSITSCNSWLDVKPTDRVLDKQLFNTEDGFKSALNGIYIELNNPILYGGDMLYDFIELIAQQYKLSGLAGDVTDIQEYNFSSTDNQDRVAKIWEKYYSLISNCNNLLGHAEVRTDVLKGDVRDIIIAETKALRAYLHFDLLRLFGPVMSLEPNAIAIPYQTEYSIIATAHLPANIVVEKIMEDLNSAANLLRKSDPIMETGAREENLDIFYSFRSQRLNYYAVTGLIARVALYANNKTLALSAAKEVIAVQKEKFPFVKHTDIVGNSVKPDRVFSTELLFSINNSKRDLIYENKFSSEIKVGDIYSPKTALDNIFGALKDKDYRYAPLWETGVGLDYRTLSKYKKLETTVYHSNIVPLIRISEMYYIVAECTNNSVEALEAINTMYNARGLDKIESIVDMSTVLKSEYRKEFYAEGQMFFFYKRTNEPQILNLTTNNYIVMNGGKYKLPIPKSETDFRQ